MAARRGHSCGTELQLSAEPAVKGAEAGRSSSRNSALCCERQRHGPRRAVSGRQRVRFGIGHASAETFGTIASRATARAHRCAWEIVIPADDLASIVNRPDDHDEFVRRLDEFSG